MRRTTPARSARDARRPVRAIHLRAASVVALAALGVGVAPAVAAPLTGTHSAIVTADKSDAVSDGGGSDGGDDNNDPTATPPEPESPEESSTESQDASASESNGKADAQGGKTASSSGTQSGPSTLKGSPSSDGGDKTPPAATESANTPGLSLGEKSLPAGKGTHVAITGFPKSSRVTVTATGPDGQSTKEFTAELPATDGDGAASTWLKVPEDAPAGEYKVTAATDDKGTTTEAELEVTEAVPDEDAALTLTPSSVPVGKSTTISGSHFWAKGSGEGSKREVTVQLLDSETNKVVKTVRPTMHEGTFTAKVKTSTKETPPGTYKVVATSGSAASEKTDSATLTVKGSTPAPPSDDGSPTGGMGGGSGSGTPTTDDPPSNSNTPPSSSSTSDAPSTTSTSPSTSSGSRSASATSEVPPATSTRDSSKEIELSAPSDDSSSKSTEKSEKKDTSEKPTKDEKSEKAKDEDKKTSDTPQETSDQPVSDQQSDATQAAATMDDDDTTSSGPTTVTTQDDGGGPLVKLFSSIGGEDASGMDRIRQVFIATLGVGFLTALGFTTASWLSRRSGTHSARAGLRQLFHRRH
ncbi:hypothetical protein [Brachybacterium sp. ACRRE]|uniref:hypothetical protein n=1 Tax=Brachybacterium sp. ACRRE TaxID=2918184 RepID=UPI001EF343E3|nr:hypothetical protein [Brachybacterium sp. ACRRE]MCG7310347.1 hypothetical protein [Brachybacterium sp. ACRRE]